MSVSETVEVAGHLMDSGILGRILDDVREYGGDYLIDKFEVGHDAHDSSRATITVTAEDDEALQRLLMRLQTRGVNQVDPGEGVVTTADLDGVFPDGFYSTTNLPTKVRLGGRSYDVANPEMDCGLVVETDGDTPVRIITLPMSDVRAGMSVVTGASGIRVQVPQVARGDEAFGFMESEDRARRSSTSRGASREDIRRVRPRRPGHRPHPRHPGGLRARLRRRLARRAALRRHRARRLRRPDGPLAPDRARRRLAREGRPPARAARGRGGPVPR